MNNTINPINVAISAERQVQAFKKAESEKIQEIKNIRNQLADMKRTLSALIYAAGSGFLDVYPQAEGFIEGRIKTLDSIEIKTRNEITEVLSEIEEDPLINQQEILKKIAAINFKDLFAFSVVTTTTPERFMTGNDEKNEELGTLGQEVVATKKRIKEHKEFTAANKKIKNKLTSTIEELKDYETGAMTDAEISEAIESRKQELVSNHTTFSSEEVAKIIDECVSLARQRSKEQISTQIEERREFLDNTTHNVEYGKINIERTKGVLKRALRDLQYKMSAFYVENLASFSIFKFWGTTSNRNAKPMNKPGFRSMNTGYEVTFTDDENKGTTIKFEAQGKGEIDYEDAEFSAKGASYHEAQKTKDGIISKNIVMPDFTIIGKDLTNKIEKAIRGKYSDITSIEDFEDLDMHKAVDEYNSYKKRISEEVKKEDGDNKQSKRKIKKKMAEVFERTKEFFIQKEIDAKVTECVNMMAENKDFCSKIKENPENEEFYNKQIQLIRKSNPELSERKIAHMARVKLLYRLKELEILKYAETSIPMYFRTNLEQISSPDISIYWYTPGESIYRFFVNRLNGLKDEDGKYVIEPQEQQKRALLRLGGLFDGDINNFYTYGKKSGILKSPNESPDEGER
ncbi:MAG: hypothetical protein J6J36_03380 [Clostridia bacterium]|nr:hypothetical protein [Clostridia bacterium]